MSLDELKDRVFDRYQAQRRLDVRRREASLMAGDLRSMADELENRPGATDLAARWQAMHESRWRQGRVAEMAQEIARLQYDIKALDDEIARLESRLPQD